MDSMNAQKEICQYAKLLYEREYSVASEGNISFRLDANRILITPSNMIKSFITEKDLVEIDMQGNTIKGKRKPSTERFTHLEIYKNNPETRAVVHAHPFFTVLTTVIGEDPFKKLFLAEAAMFLKDVRIAPYAKPSTTEGSDAIRNLCRGSQILIIEKHGSFTYGKDLHTAFSLLEILEKYCSMHYHAKLSGKKIQYIDKKEIEALSKIPYGK
jgi:L-fuculose-phosphate aldolase